MTCGSEQFILKSSFIASSTGGLYTPIRSNVSIQSGLNENFVSLNSLNSSSKGSRLPAVGCGFLHWKHSGPPPSDILIMHLLEHLCGRFLSASSVISNQSCFLFNRCSCNELQSNLITINHYVAFYHKIWNFMSTVIISIRKF